MGCNVGEPGYMKPRRGILEQDEVLAKDMRSHRPTEDISMTSLTDIIKNGQAAYEATLPEYLRRQVAPAEVERRIILTLTDERQREICLNCPLADCVGIERRECPIQIEQRAEWRRQNHRRVSQ